MSHPDQHIIERLLEKHALGICTPEERAVLERWYAAFPAEGRVFEDEAERQTTRESMKAGLFAAIGAPTEAAADPVPEKRPVRHLYWRAAAAVLVLIVAGGLFYLFNSKPAPVTYTLVTAPAGKSIYHLQLPDGSAMWLEPGTRLRYADNFGKRSRDVQMVDGMAYFTVAKGASHPFTVSTPAGIQAKVLGTEFTVKAYESVPYIQVAVREGVVQVSDSNAVIGTLKAGQEIVYQLDAHTATRTDGPVNDWRKGNLTLLNSSFTEVARILQNRYQAKVTFDTAMMAPYRFNLQINEQTSLEDMMEILKALSGMTYTLSNGQVTVTGVQQ